MKNSTNTDPEHSSHRTPDFLTQAGKYEDAEIKKAEQASNNNSSTNNESKKKDAGEDPSIQQSTENKQNTDDNLFEDVLQKDKQLNNSPNKNESTKLDNKSTKIEIKSHTTPLDFSEAGIPEGVEYTNNNDGEKQNLPTVHEENSESNSSNNNLDQDEEQTKETQVNKSNDDIKEEQQENNPNIQQSAENNNQPNEEEDDNLFADALSDEEKPDTIKIEGENDSNEDPSLDSEDKQENPQIRETAKPEENPNKNDQTKEDDNLFEDISTVKEEEEEEKKNNNSEIKTEKNNDKAASSQQPEDDSVIDSSQQSEEEPQEVNSIPPKINKDSGTFATATLITAATGTEKSGGNDLNFVGDNSQGGPNNNFNNGNNIPVNNQGGNYENNNNAPDIPNNNQNDDNGNLIAATNPLLKVGCYALGTFAALEASYNLLKHYQEYVPNAYKTAEFIIKNPVKIVEIYYNTIEEYLPIETDNIRNNVTTILSVAPIAAFAILAPFAYLGATIGTTAFFINENFDEVCEYSAQVYDNISLYMAGINTDNDEL